MTKIRAIRKRYLCLPVAIAIILVMATVGIAVAASFASRTVTIEIVSPTVITNPYVSDSLSPQIAQGITEVPATFSVYNPNASSLDITATCPPNDSLPGGITVNTNIITQTVVSGARVNFTFLFHIPSGATPQIFSAIPIDFSY